ncbi:ornithine carbamoyltransferase [Paracoccaceae bacterium]|jgi:ornithine carbamoyltransferase|nr:ornithine carbamoyltransferase [Paracoccaceae bacterium]RCL81862.1 MAG: ornithine carbamoyltransferase [Paracoccaceae bacterium]|tara:strand:+ start:334 stop:1260 length:927 start_codon:yes stop_codon:yes gene_type:complete
MKHFLNINEMSTEDLTGILKHAQKMKTDRLDLPKGTYDEGQPLSQHIVALVFEKPSTRTRTSFDVGVRQLGGQPMLLSGTEMHLGKGETISDTARVLSRYVDLIMLRTFESQTLYEMAKHSTVPVINGLTNESHPCQIMADIMTFEEKRGSIKGKKVVWFGDSNNVFNSFLQAAEKFNFSLIFSGPKELDPPKNLIKNAKNLKIDFKIDRDPISAIKDADLVATDTWVSMHDNPEEKQNRHNQLKAFQVNEELMSKANHEALFMHCLPAHRNEEATSGVLDGKNSVIFDEAENRLHVQKAIMRWCLSK